MSKDETGFYLLINKFFFSLSQFLFNTPTSDDIDSYFYEAKCQLLMYASISIIKLNAIVCI
jgi:hypothetical protein